MKPSSANHSIEHGRQPFTSLAITLTAMGAFSLWCAASQAQGPMPVLEALPTAEALGPGWSREVSVLFDPASKPAELFAASSRLPESFKKERREAVQNPTNRISGWSHTHFTFQSTNTTHHYDVQVERYRSQDHLRADFAQLLAFYSAKYQELPVNGVGDAAAFYRRINGGATVWFRRADFKVWIWPMATVTNWEQDAHLQRLARLLDERILAATAQGMKPSQPKNERNKP
jgi:hypothetical protein